MNLLVKKVSASIPRFLGGEYDADDCGISKVSHNATHYHQYDLSSVHLKMIEYSIHVCVQGYCWLENERGHFTKNARLESLLPIYLHYKTGVPVYLTPWTAYPPGGKLTAVGLPPGGKLSWEILPPPWISSPRGGKLSRPVYLAPTQFQVLVVIDFYTHFFNCPKMKMLD